MKLIHPPVFIRINSTILITGAILILICIPVALIYDEPLRPFLCSSLLIGSIGLFFRLAYRKVDITRTSPKDGYISVTLAWFFLSTLCAMPYIFSGTIPNFVDAFFEATSGVTTTGSSILTDIESLPKSILFWRSMTHWIGGFGIILLVIIILPSLKITAQQLLTLESSLNEKILPQTKSIVFRLLFVYIGLTIIETILLYLGEMDLFDSICHSFGTIATGGFSTKNDSIAGFSNYTQNIITLFMFLSGISFVLYYYLAKGKYRKILKNEEFWFYLGVVFLSGTIISLLLYTGSGKGLLSSMQEGFFQVVSIITTTGFSSVDFIIWPGVAITFLFILMFSGGSTGSTSGGIKMIRHLIVQKNIKNVFRQLGHPNAIRQIRINGKTLSEKANISVLSFVLLYILVFFVGSTLIILTGIDPVTAVSSSITTLGGIGPALGTAGPMSSFSHFPGIAKIILCVLMILGRLELLTVFALFSRSFWKP